MFESMGIGIGRTLRFAPASHCTNRLRKIRMVPGQEVLALPGGRDSYELFNQPRFHALPYDIRNKILDAVSELDFSGTAADVAQKSSLSIDDTDKYLQALAIDAGGRLKVTDKGDIIYSFPDNVNLRLQQQHFMLSSEAYIRYISKAALQMARITFGTVLVGSVAFTTVALTAIAIAAATTSDSDSSGSMNFSFRDEDRERSQGSSGSLWLWWDPWPDMTCQDRQTKQAVHESKDTRGGGFFQDAFAVVFGGPDPNADFERERWQVVGGRIAACGGVVAAEDLRPLLDAPSGDAAHEEEYMLPVLLRFNGTADLAHVPGHGTALLYTFPQLQRTAASARPLQPDTAAADAPHGTGLRGALSRVLPWLRRFTASVERPSQDSAFVAYTGKQAYAQKHRLQVLQVHPSNAAPLSLLVAANCALVSALHAAVRSPSVMHALQQSSGPGFARLVAAAVPVLTLYASLYVVGPAVRWALQLLPNARIASGNAARAAAAEVLENPSPELESKLRLARSQAQRIDVRTAHTVYDTAREDDTRDNGGSWNGRGDAQYEMDNWDSKLQRRTR